MTATETTNETIPREHTLDSQSNMGPMQKSTIGPGTREQQGGGKTPPTHSSRVVAEIEAKAVVAFRQLPAEGFPTQRTATSYVISDDTKAIYQIRITKFSADELTNQNEHRPAMGSGAFAPGANLMGPTHKPT